jgi:hypothetical protein
MGFEAFARDLPEFLEIFGGARHTDNRPLETALCDQRKECRENFASCEIA